MYPVNDKRNKKYTDVLLYMSRTGGDYGVDEIRRRIVTDVYKPGERIPSVRDLAAEAEVNANTMQKALSELEREELVLTSRSTGRTVTNDVEKIKGTRKAMAERELSRCMTYMKELGYSIEEIQNLIADYKS